MLFQPREPPVRSHQARSTRRDLTYPPRLTAAVLPPGGKDCDFVRSGVPKVGFRHLRTRPHALVPGMAHFNPEQAARCHGIFT